MGLGIRNKRLMALAVAAAAGSNNVTRSAGHALGQQPYGLNNMSWWHRVSAYDSNSYGLGTWRLTANGAAAGTAAIEPAVCGICSRPTSHQAQLLCSCCCSDYALETLALRDYAVATLILPIWRESNPQTTWAQQQYVAARHMLGAFMRDLMALQLPWRSNSVERNIGLAAMWRKQGQQHVAATVCAHGSNSLALAGWQQCGRRCEAWLMGGAYQRNM
ncbi:hypothetical protein KOW79_021603 [Hemibagrus wyckioides]|uniref:Uncharacterized protein n=1 Tax=Hemibagrus wyckioides TaxID=337641 RepID=A0A9D3S8J1_9TELE|nr:hypothetical protein KOW79_021603 [Hemibagrus wyckioides]